MYPLKMMSFHGFLYVYQAGYIRNERPPAYEDTELPLHQRLRFTSKRDVVEALPNVPVIRVIRVIRVT